jgi:hypothetical protein
MSVVELATLPADVNKLLVRRLVDEAVRERNLDVLDQIAAGEFAEIAKRWVRPFQSAFPDFASSASLPRRPEPEQ